MQAQERRGREQSQRLVEATQLRAHEGREEEGRGANAPEVENAKSGEGLR